MKGLLEKMLACLLMLCLCCPAARADMVVFSGASVESLVSLSGELYGSSWQGIMRLDGEGWTMAADGVTNARCLAASGTALYVLEQESMDEYRVERLIPQADGVLAGPEPVCETRLDAVTVFAAASTDEELYLLCADESSLDWDTRLLYAVSLADGAVRTLAKGALSGLAVYKDGRLLSLRNHREIVALNPASGEEEVLAELPVAEDETHAGGLAYDAETDVLCYRTSEGVFGLDGDLDEPRQLGFLSAFSSSYDDPAVIHRGRYYLLAWQNESGYVSSALDPNLLPKRTLRISTGATVANLLSGFVLEHPDIAVQSDDSTPGRVDVMLRDMQSEQASDVYLIGLDWGFFGALREKKYAVDLSSSEILMETVGRMDPNLTKDFLVDGRLYAVPVAVSASVPELYPAAFERVGLPVEDAPRSYEELLDFIVRWHDDFLAEQDEVTLFGATSEDLFAELLEDMLDLRLLACEREGISPSFGTPEMRKLLTRLEEIRPLLSEVAPKQEGWVIIDLSGGSDRNLMDFHGNPLPANFRSSGDVPVVPLSLTKGGEPVIPLQMDVLLVNPYSEHQDAAIELLEYVAEHLSPSLRATLMPDENTPIEDAFATQRIEALEEELAALEAQRESVAPEELAEYESRLKDQRVQLAQARENLYAFNAEDLVRYHAEVMPHLAVMSSPFHSANAFSTLDSLKKRYLDGQIGLEQFLAECDRTVETMLLEQ